ncbi:dTDP-4-dehydrorhamnose 3,5-epimerase family protein [Mesorhizobium sp. L2C066B000]|uniref:dTDP-4-dehydrorhamnose 3,5-epimerase family protein n=1 Tax=Mesorhizobium sp. L2C066B000 TaxID=1287105 RepID=UPI000B1563DC|nr:dTDP-4-dehydrorhamnose 3,5-epimerase family protein [Mesorhizobium sp. L2C066B000]
MPEKTRTKPTGWMATGTADGQVVTPDWIPIEPVAIDGVRVKEIRPVATSTGYLTEIFRQEWELDSEPVGQVFQRTLYPGAVTGWHAHAVTTDRLFCCVGSVRISLFDGRKASPTFGAVWHKIIGPLRPAVVIIPPGIWHGVVSLGAETAVLLNLVDKAYAYDQPDHWRLPPDTDHIPYRLV